MAEIIGTIFSSAIPYVYQIAVILFVLKEFGYIKTGNKPETEQNNQQANKQETNAGPMGGLDFGGLFQGVMKNMTKELSKAQNGGVELETDEDDEPAQPAKTFKKKKKGTVSFGGEENETKTAQEIDQ